MGNINPGKNHIQGLDLVRFMAALMVMIYHLVYWRNGAYPTLGSNPRNLVWFGWIGVEIFFVLSGFVIAYSAEKAAAVTFVRGRILRLMPSVWICGSITALALLLTPDAHQIKIAKDYIETILMFPSGPKIDIVYWTLTVEVSFYILVALVLRFLKFDYLVGIMMVIGSISLLFNFMVFIQFTRIFSLPDMLSHAIVKMHQTHIFRLLQFHYGCFFALGVVIWKWSRQPQNLRWFAAMFLMALGCAAVVMVNSTVYVAEKGLTDVIFCLPAIVWSVATGLIVYFSAGGAIPFIGNRFASTIRTIGLMTYPLYLLHNECGLAVFHRLAAAGVNVWLSTLAAAALSLIASLAVVKVLDPPVTRILRNFIEQLSARVRHIPIVRAAVIKPTIWQNSN